MSYSFVSIGGWICCVLRSSSMIAFEARRYRDDWGHHEELLSGEIT